MRKDARWGFTCNAKDIWVSMIATPRVNIRRLKPRLLLGATGMRVFATRSSSTAQGARSLCTVPESVRGWIGLDTKSTAKRWLSFEKTRRQCSSSPNHCSCLTSQCTSTSLLPGSLQFFKSKCKIGSLSPLSPRASLTLISAGFLACGRLRGMMLTAKRLWYGS